MLKHLHHMKQQGVVFVDVALAVWIEQVADVAACEHSDLTSWRGTDKLEEDITVGDVVGNSCWEENEFESGAGEREWGKS